MNGGLEKRLFLRPQELLSRAPMLAASALP
jgi:hypothetical protein